MKPIKLILGDITFLDEKIDGINKALVNTIDEIIDCKTVEEAQIKGEAGLENHEAYLIPSEYNYEIIYDIFI